MPLTVVPARALFEPVTADLNVLQRSLIEAGMTVHYPAVAVLNNGRPVGNAWAGFRNHETYVRLIGSRLHDLASGLRSAVAPLVPVADVADVQLLASIGFEDRPGAFYRRVPGTRYIAFDTHARVRLYHLESGAYLPAPGRLDFVPSPDGMFFVTPGFDGMQGLHFYSGSEVIERGLPEAVGPFPLLVDSTMTDEYPSVGVLTRSPEFAYGVRYRVLTAWYDGAAYREYEVPPLRGSGEPAVDPVGPRVAVCPRRELSLPLLSKDGTEMSARDERDGVTKVFRIGLGLCEEVFNTGMQTSKATFSPDGNLLAFGATDHRRRGTIRSFVYVVDRRTSQTRRIPYSESASLTIPEFVGPDSLLFLVTERPEGGVGQLRLVCCVAGDGDVARH